MEYINKIHAPQANAIIDAYLRNIRIPGQYRPRELYQGFSSRFGRNNLINDELLPEQGNGCFTDCYRYSAVAGNICAGIDPLQIRCR